jgi:hypothetical protein
VVAISGGNHRMQIKKNEIGKIFKKLKLEVRRDWGRVLIYVIGDGY